MRARSPYSCLTTFLSSIFNRGNFSGLHIRNLKEDFYEKESIGTVKLCNPAAASITGCSSQKPAESAAASAEAESTTGAPSKEVGDYKIALITMDSIDQHWVTLNEGAQEEAKELGVTVSFMSPNTKDDAQQIECVNNAVAGGYQAIIVAANGPDAISSALKEAKDAGIKIVYVDSPANVEAEATFSTDNEAAGTTAGNEMLKALKDAGVTSGKIGIVNVNAATDSTVKREAGFRKAFEGTDFELMETQYGKVTRRSPRPSLRTTSHRALSVSSAATKVPRPVPVMPSRHPAIQASSALASINLTRS